MVLANDQYYTLANKKTYDVWGKVRSDAGASGPVVNPNTKYCANLGHKYDEGTELTYMRARYYEAATGRFISEDPAAQGINWYSYCGNEPVSHNDPSGKVSETDARAFTAFMGTMAGAIGFASIAVLATCGEMGSAAAIKMAQYSCLAYSLAVCAVNPDWKVDIVGALCAFGMDNLIVSAIKGAGQGKRAGGLAMAAVAAVTAYTIWLIAELTCLFVESMNS